MAVAGGARRQRSPSGTRRGNVKGVLRGEISPSREHAVGAAFKWVCLLTLVGVARVPAVMKTTTTKQGRVIQRLCASFTARESRHESLD